MNELLEHSRESIDKGSKSFALASKVLDPASREIAIMLYAYCRWADDLVDGQTLGHGQDADYRQGQAERVERLRSETLSALGGRATSFPPLLALAEVVRRTSMPSAYVMQLVEGFQMDADRREYVSVGDTLDYSYHVAGVVGVMMAWIMGVRDDPTLDRASDLGLAFQLTNIARDVIDDAKAGRVFVPQELLKAHGAPIHAEDIAQEQHWKAVHAAATDLLDIAEPYYDSARVGAARLSYRNAWGIETARRVYREIGEKLRDGGPNAWAGRVSTSKGRKLALASLSAFSAMRLGQVPSVSREGFYERPT